MQTKDAAAPMWGMHNDTGPVRQKRSDIHGNQEATG